VSAGIETIDEEKSRMTRNKENSPTGKRGRSGRDARRAHAVAEWDAYDAAGYADSHEGWGPTARYFHSRMYAVEESLRGCLGGELLDVGCGPGMMVRRLLDTRPGEFRITACDRSETMMEEVAARTTGAENVELVVANIEDMPFEDKRFDVVLAMGVLEYTDAASALRELARVTQPDGLVVITMLNPLSPYRLFEWGVYWTARRLLGSIERLAGVPAERRHGASRSGIRALPAARLRTRMREAGLLPEDQVYYDLSPLVPPLDKIARRRFRQWRTHPERTVSRGARGWIGTAYLVTGRRSPA
jgi:ubiquinone/menaquinone biosynthesis C-methylase UbiE